MKINGYLGEAKVFIQQNLLYATSPFLIATQFSALMFKVTADLCWNTSVRKGYCFISFTMLKEGVYTLCDRKFCSRHFSPYLFLFSPFYPLLFVCLSTFLTFNPDFLHALFIFKDLCLSLLVYLQRPNLWNVKVR